MSYSLFEKLANLTFIDKERETLINEMPTDLRAVILSGDSTRIRQAISRKTDFPDARTVAGYND